jgi:hypothetical protein
MTVSEGWGLLRMGSVSCGAGIRPLAWAGIQLSDFPEPFDVG